MLEIYNEYLKYSQYYYKSSVRLVSLVRVANLLLKYWIPSFPIELPLIYKLIDIFVVINNIIVKYNQSKYNSG